MRSLMRNPRFWLAVQMLAVLILIGAGGLLTLRTSPDSASYVEASELPLGEMLRGIRTIGYPLILRTVRPFSPDFGIMPLVHLGLHFLAVFAFDFGLRRFGASPWQAFAAASGLLYTIINDAAVSQLLTDCTGMAAAAVAISFLLWVSASPKQALPWIGLTVGVACTYHVRPAYLFLIPLVPCLGLVLLRIRTGSKGEPFPWLKHGLGLCCVSIVPYLAFCLLRLAVVGHFGLVSFAGANLIGITADMLDREAVAARLPDEWRPLAAEIARTRSEQGIESPFRSRGIDMRRWLSNYPKNVWEVGYPAASRLYGDDPVVVNRKLVEFSRAVILAGKKTYLRFLAYNLRDGLGKFLQRGWVLQAFGAIAVFLFTVRVLLCPRRLPELNRRDDLPASSLMVTLLLLGLMFAFSKMLLVGLVEVFVPRYVYAAGLFLPPIFALVIYRELGKIRAAWRLAREPSSPITVGAAGRSRETRGR